jgi:hypothetical protein
VTVAVQAADVAEAVGAAWSLFQQAAGEVGGWDIAAARAEVHPAAQRSARNRQKRPLLPGYGHACGALTNFRVHDVATGT